MNFENGDYIEAKIDVSSLDKKIQNVFSIGENIDVWSISNDGYYNLHFFYPNAYPHDKKIKFSAVIGEKYNNLTRRTMGIVDIEDEENLIIKFDKNGLWIDNKLILDGDFTIEDERPANTYTGQFMDHFKTGSHTLQIGSTEGKTRSWAWYDYIMYHHER